MPPITLTKPQFYKKRPKGSYDAYLNYIRSARSKPPPPAAAPKPRPGSQLPTYNSLLRSIQLQTPAQMEAQARRMAQIGIDSQMKMIREEAERMRSEARQRAEAMAAAGRAAAEMNAGLFAQVGGEFNAGAQEMRGMATGLAGSAAGATAGEAAAANAGLAAVGAPAMAVGGPMGAASLAGPGQAHVEAYKGGELPGQALTTAGEAATFGLAGLVSSQNLRATQEAMASWRQAVAEVNSNRMAAIKELALGRPEAAAKFLAQLQAANARARDTAMSLLAAREAFKSSSQRRGLNVTAEQRAAAAELRAQAAAKREADKDAEALRVSKLNRRQAVEKAKLQGREVDLVRSRALKYYVDMQGRPILNSKGGKIKFVEKPSADSTSPTKTIGEVRQDVAKAAQDFVKASYGGLHGTTLIRTKRQLVDSLRAQFPGVKKEVIWRIANSVWPATTTKKGGSGKLEPPPGTK